MTGAAAIAGMVHGKETQTGLTEEIEIEIAAMGVRLHAKTPLFELCLIFLKDGRKSLKVEHVPSAQIEAK